MTIASGLRPDPSGPECVVLDGGPRSGEWYFVGDWDIRRQSATAMDRSARDVQGWALGYHSTERTTTHLDEKMRYEPRCGDGPCWRCLTPPSVEM